MNDSAIEISTQNAFVAHKTNLISLLKLTEELLQIDLKKLQSRIENNCSLLLVTGDLNSGKSTFCNALLRKRVVEENNEPSKAMFVHISSKIHNSNKEEIHLYKGSNFVKRPIDKLQLVFESDGEFDLIKVFIDNQNTLLSNDLFQISLIDSPGLNINSMKNTALLEKEREIDVVLFVVNAENHFTQSGREFLQKAAREKQYVFLIVNKIDNIKKRERNRAEILAQLKEISPFTFENASELVHFISAKRVFDHDDTDDAYKNDILHLEHFDQDDPDDAYKNDFVRLEKSLCKFVLEKRTISKLAPAKVYLTTVLDEFKKTVSKDLEDRLLKKQELNTQIRASEPHYKQMIEFKAKYLDTIDDFVQEFGNDIENHARTRLTDFLGGKMQIKKEFRFFAEAADWNNIFGAWDYAKQIRGIVSRLASVRLRSCHEYSSKYLINKLETIYAAANEIIPMEFEFEGLEERSDSVVEIQEQSMFDSTDRLSIVSDFIPSIGIMSLGFFSYRSMVTGVLGRAINFGSNGKLVCAGVAFAGLGMLVLKLADLQNVIQSKMLDKMDEFFESAHFVSRNALYFRKSSTKVLRKEISDLTKKFGALIIEREQMVFRQNQLKERLEKEISDLSNSNIRAETLLSKLAHIDLTK